jgi:hypothetical protein
VDWIKHQSDMAFTFFNCCCCSNRIGALIIGALLILPSMFGIFWTTYVLISNGKPSYYNNRGDVLIFQLVIACSSLLFNIMLVIGAVKKIKCLMEPWMSLSILLSGALSIILIVLLISSITNGDIHDSNGIGLILVIGVLVLSVNCYLTAIVVNAYIDIKLSESNTRPAFLQNPRRPFYGGSDRRGTEVLIVTTDIINLPTDNSLESPV